ncbi:hypothetical protein MSG28_011576 [Choristoneura fumiferana]|uniref:Uncharacterized protein n=1 Tax=Choristoneura fumiferana TaxID=7141 RepID=A0ACC0JNW9_CHOFU|nr:hypothetical protein MSG28_011576 [Choristoneura fumiferana]
MTGSLDQMQTTAQEETKVPAQAACVDKFVAESTCRDQRERVLRHVNRMTECIGAGTKYSVHRRCASLDEKGEKECGTNPVEPAHLYCSQQAATLELELSLRAKPRVKAKPEGPRGTAPSSPPVATPLLASYSSQDPGLQATMRRSKICVYKTMHGCELVKFGHYRHRQTYRSSTNSTAWPSAGILQCLSGRLM